MAVLLFALIFFLKTSQPGECLNNRQTLFHKIKQNYLRNHVIATKQADNEFECVMHCVSDDFSCASVNFKTSGVGKGLCELNNLTLPTTKDESILNPEFDHLHIVRTEESNLVQSGVEPHTTQKSGDFDLVLKNVQNFTLHVEDVPELSNFTLMFWINIISSEADSMTILSYDVEKIAQGFWLKIWRARVILKFPSSKKVLHVPPIKDGYWHHVGVSWSLGKYAIFLDGTLVYSGNDLGSSSPLKAGGVFILGPKLKSTNGTPEHSFSGKLSQLNVWSEFLSTTDDVEKKFISQSCLNIEFGDVINWSSLKDSHGDMVVKEQPSSCKPLRKNPKYDIVITQSQDVHTLKWEEIQQLDAFTITTWVKYEKTPVDLDTAPLNHRYVDYTNASGTPLLLFYLTADNLTLEIDGVVRREARIPMFWNEEPAYWHHIATTWSSSTGHWKIYLDGSLVSIMHDVASNITIPAGGQLSLKFSGYMHNISQSRLNIWNYEIDGRALSLMANKGPLFENGNIFAWYGIRSKVKEDVYFKETPDDLHNSRAESVYEMNFPEASVRNYVKMEKVVNYDLTEVSACFWANFFKTPGAIFAYSSLKNIVEIQAYLYDSLVLDLEVKNNFTDKGPKISAYDSWHFYCLQWRSFDGLIEVYQDGKKIGTEYKEKNHAIHFNGVVVLGQELDSYGGGFDGDQAFKGSLAGLNLWSQFLTTNVIQGMASGILNVNGNLLQWRDFRDHVFGDIVIQNESGAEIPEYRIQNQRDEWCKRNVSKASAYARFIRGRDTDGYRWRCVQAAAMLDENMCYDITKNLFLYRTKHTKKELLGIN